jgi:hypothetical protein
MPARRALVLVVLVSMATAAAPVRPDEPLVWSGSVWSQCKPEELLPRNGECEVVSDTGKRVLPDSACETLLWQGAVFGGGLGCTTTCTCVRDPRAPRDGLCDHALCPGDRVCKDDRRFLGLWAGMAVLEGTPGQKNCWRAVMKPMPRARTRRAKPGARPPGSPAPRPSPPKTNP